MINPALMSMAIPTLHIINIEPAAQSTTLSPYNLLSGESLGGLDAVTTVVDFLFDQFTNLVQTIASTPLLLIPVGIFMAGAVIGLAKRLIGT